MAPRSKVPQRYFAAAQAVHKDGKVQLTLLEESKDTGSCHVLIRSQDFVNRYADLNLPVRVVIIREEPALCLVRKPNELAAKIQVAAGDRTEQVLKVLTEGGVSITGDVDFEDAEEPAALQRTQEEGQEAPQGEAAPAAGSEVPAPPPSASEVPAASEGPPPTAPPTPPPAPPLFPSAAAPQPPAAPPPQAASPSGPPVAAPPPAGPPQTPTTEAPPPPAGPPPGPPAPPPPPPAPPSQGQGAAAPPPLGPPPPEPQGGMVEEKAGPSGQAADIPVGDSFGVPPGAPPPPPGPPPSPGPPPAPQG